MRSSLTQSLWSVAVGSSLLLVPIVISCGGNDSVTGGVATGDGGYYDGRPDSVQSDANQGDAALIDTGATDAKNDVSQCEPETCKSLKLDCGEIYDKCGKIISCGNCFEGLICGGGGPNICGAACTKRNCKELGANCGIVSNGCDAMLDCGSCDNGQVCGAESPNLCGSKDAGQNDTSDSSVDGPDFPCPATTIKNCTLPQTNSGDSSPGKCVNETTGACQYSCLNGSWTLVSNTCSVTCAAQSVSWLQCSGSLPTGAEGKTSTITNTTSDYLGTSSWKCKNGSWTKTDESCTRKLCSYDWGSDVATNGAYVKIYVTLAARSPEPTGLWYWNGQGYSPNTIAYMADCIEPTKEFGNWANPDFVVEHIYRTAFNRAADSGGKAYFLGKFSDGTYATTGAKFGQFVMAFLDAAGGSDITSLKNREEVASYWVKNLVDHRCPWDDFGKTVLVNVNHLTDVKVVKASIDSKISEMENKALTGSFPGGAACH